MYLQEFVIALCRHEKASILQLHLSILQQIIQNWENIPLRLLQTLQDQNPAFSSSSHSTLK